MKHARSRWGNSWLLPALVCAALSSGCSSAPPVLLHSVHGDVRAYDVSQAEQAARWLDELQPLIESWLPGSRAGRRFEVWHLPDKTWPSSHTGSRGLYFEQGQIHLRVNVPSDDLDVPEVPNWAQLSKGALAHELVHGLLDESWSTLPAFIEEGLCEVLEDRAVPELLVRRGVHHGLLLLRLADPLRVLVRVTTTAGIPTTVEGPEPTTAAVTLSTTASVRLEAGQPPSAGEILGTHGEIPPRWEGEAEEVGRALGYTLANRIVQRGGVEALYTLATDAQAQGRASIPADALLKAAGIEVLDEHTVATLAAELLANDEAPQWLALRFADLVDESMTKWQRAANAMDGTPGTPHVEIEIITGEQVRVRHVLPPVTLAR